LPVRARFRPHAKGFGFATPVGPDHLTATTFTHQGEAGPKTFDSVFVPPDLAKGKLADDLVDLEVEVDEKGASATEVTVVERPITMLVGKVVQGPGQLVVEPDSALGSGWVQLEGQLDQQLRLAVGREVVVLLGQDADGGAVARALVAGPHVAGSPDAVRASAVVVALNRAAPSLIPGGASSAGIDPVTAAGTATRIIGLLAGGGRGGAAGLDFNGPVPGLDLPGVDLTDDLTITIDDTATRDVDDALSAHWDHDPASDVHVAVHIADAGRTIGVGSPADTYARVMAATSYLEVGASAPMLDPALAEEALSLLPGEERGALSLHCRITPDGEVVDADVELAVIRSDAKLSYAAVEQWLDGDAGPVLREVTVPGDGPEVEDTLIALREAAERLGVQRDERDTIEELFTQAEVEPAILDGKIRTRHAEPHAEAYRLVERMMVAANEAVAAWLVQNDVPALYRVHSGLKRDALPRLRAAVELASVDVPALAHPDDEVDLDTALTQLMDAIGAVGEGSTRELLTGVVAGSIARASYEPDPAAHRGLASSAYVHFTSPIRRYADLVVHRQIRAALAGEEPPHSAEELGPLAGWLDARAGAANYAAIRERNDLWAILLDRGFLDGPEPAVVSGVTRNGLRVRLPRLGVTGFLRAEDLLGTEKGERASLEVDEHGLTTTGGPWRVGSTVKVRVKGRDFSGRVDLRPAD
jgi:ribonuclease R